MSIAVLQVRGSKSKGTGMLHRAIARLVLLIVVSEMRIYLRKQSLDHRPMLCMRYFGHPMAAAVEAAPILNECDEIFAAPFEVSRKILLTSERVR